MQNLFCSLSRHSNSEPKSQQQLRACLKCSDGLSSGGSLVETLGGSLDGFLDGKKSAEERNHVLGCSD